MSSRRQAKKMEPLAADPVTVAPQEPNGSSDNTDATVDETINLIPTITPDPDGDEPQDIPATLADEKPLSYRFGRFIGRHKTGTVLVLGIVAAAAITAGLQSCQPSLLPAASPVAIDSSTSAGDPSPTSASGTAQQPQESQDDATADAEPEAAPTDAPSESTQDADDEDMADWTITYKTVHHDAVTHVEHVPAVYGKQTTYHTIRNDTQEIVDGHAEQYMVENGGPGITTNVPVTDEVIIQDAYDETVVDQPAYDETVPDQMVNLKTHETRPVTAADLGSAN